ncbi:MULTISPECIES: hypothetical protein [unclassified Campylobacter]|uniref:hypothetical protein n=1 Tax=unclassified Campylobacter TaxID=2593542 RepID=UPI0022E9D0E0|nr:MULTISPECIES: hypothetical protein [unclassified Campylobacter]MDA3056442.1 hypothetical protein [Campylobacter sp. CN_NA1]MDA3069375.1 hypothetical protein [Campylobacter sp. CN_NE3]
MSMFCKCKFGIKTKCYTSTGKRLIYESSYITCTLNVPFVNLSVKECRHCVFYPIKEALKKG